METQSNIKSQVLSKFLTAKEAEYPFYFVKAFWELETTHEIFNDEVEDFLRASFTRSLDYNARYKNLYFNCYRILNKFLEISTLIIDQVDPAKEEFLTKFFTFMEQSEWQHTLERILESALMDESYTDIFEDGHLVILIYQNLKSMINIIALVYEENNFTVDLVLYNKWLAGYV